MNVIVRCRRGFQVFLLALLVSAPVRAMAAGEYRTVDVESLKITIDSEWGGRTAPGYLPVRFDITNLGEARVIDIIAQGSRFFRPSRGMPGAPTAINLQQRIRLARGDRVRLTVPVPIVADNENIRFEIQEDGRTIERFNYTGFQSRVPAADASALIVADPASPSGIAAASWPRHVTPGRVAAGGRTLPLLDFVLHPSRLPTNWLGYTSVRAVAIGPVEWDQLNETQKNALLAWTACGGDLIVVDGDPAALLPAGTLSAGAGPAPTVRAYFFGRIHQQMSASIGASGLADVLAAAQKVQDSNFALPVNRAVDWGIVGPRGFRLPIPGVGGVPARGYLLILLTFAFLIGPANYWLLWRKRQQVLLVLTTPLISALFIILLAGYVIAGEGLGVRGRAVTVTMLDQARKQAATRASLSLYAAGMTPFGGLRVARDLAIFATGPDGSGSREAQVVDLSEAQRFAAGAIQARAPSNIEQVGFRPVRERLAFDREGGGLQVVNGLGAAITFLRYREAGAIYALTTPLAAGAKTRLSDGPIDTSGVVPADLPWSARLAHLLENQPDGSYLAVLDRSPYWDPGVSGVVEHGSFHLVLGWPGGQP
jgi:hypothetical protein